MAFITSPSVSIHQASTTRRCRRGRVMACTFPPTVDSTRAYLAAARPAAIEQQRLEQLLAMPMAPDNAMLLLAARLGDATTIRRLLSEADVDVNVQDTEGSTAAMRAASRGHVECLRLLLESGRLDMEVTNHWGYDMCIYVGSVRNSYPAAYEEMLSLLLENGVEDVRGRAERRWTQRPAK